MNATDEAVSLTVNGEAIPQSIENGYLTIDRSWKPGDVIQLTLPMPIRRVVAHDGVEADRGRMALQRGPIVYTAEWPDNPHGKVRNIVVPDTTALTTEFRADLLNGVQVIKGRVNGLAYDAQGGVTKTEQDLVAIPYATWANRGPGQMIVWLARTDAAAKPTPWPTVATGSTVTSSPAQRSAGAVNDGEEPTASNDRTSFFDWWPHRGTTEWVEYAFAKPATVSKVQVYWFEAHAPRRGARARLVACALRGPRQLEAGRDGRFVRCARGPVHNDVSFAPVTTTGLRLEVTLEPGWSAGLQEWKVR